MRASWTSGWPVGILLVLFVMASVAAATSAPAHPTEESFAWGAGEPVFEENSAEAVRFHDLLEALEPTARKLYPEVFAGVWIDDSRVVHVAFTENPEKYTDDLISVVEYPWKAVPEQAEHTLVEMEAGFDALVALKNESDAADAQAMEPFDASLDIVNGVINVTTEASPSDVEEAASRVTDVPFSVSQGKLSQPDACDGRKNCDPDLRAGLQTKAPSSSCSTAFTVRNSDGNRRLLSAAHCGNSGTSSSSCGTGDGGDARYHGDPTRVRYGQVVNQRCRDNVDAELHSVALNGFNAVPRVFVNSDHKGQPVESTMQWENLTVGERVCLSGVTSGKSCGPVRSKMATVSYVPGSERFVQADYCVAGGDSGGAVYLQDVWSRAVGIHSGSSGSCEAKFGFIRYALDHFNVTLVTN